MDWATYAEPFHVETIFWVRRDRESYWQSSFTLEPDGAVLFLVILGGTVFYMRAVTSALEYDA